MTANEYECRAIEFIRKRQLRICVSLRNSRFLSVFMRIKVYCYEKKDERFLSNLQLYIYYPYNPVILTICAKVILLPTPSYWKWYLLLSEKYLSEVNINYVHFSHDPCRNILRRLIMILITALKY